MYPSRESIFSLWVGLQSDNSGLPGNHRRTSSTRTVYEAFYGLREKTFSPLPEPSFLYLGRPLLPPPRVGEGGALVTIRRRERRPDAPSPLVGEGWGGG
jgi:hypothetical protein